MDNKSIVRRVDCAFCNTEDSSVILKIVGGLLGIDVLSQCTECDVVQFKASVNNNQEDIIYTVGTQEDMDKLYDMGKLYT